MERAYGYAARDVAGEIREEHLLEALLAESDGRALLGDTVDADALPQISEELAASRRKGGLTAAEEAAMGSLGIDVEGVVEQIEARLGAHALSVEEDNRSRWWHRPVFSPGATDVLAQAERHLSAAGGRSLKVEHVSLGLVSSPTALAESLARRGVTSPWRSWSSPPHQASSTP